MSTTAVAQIITRIDQADESRTIQRLQQREVDLSSYGRSGWRIDSTITVPSGESTLIVDTLTKTTDQQ